MKMEYRSCVTPTARNVTQIDQNVTTSVTETRYASRARLPFGKEEGNVTPYETYTARYSYTRSFDRSRSVTITPPPSGGVTITQSAAIDFDDVQLRWLKMMAAEKFAQYLANHSDVENIVGWSQQKRDAHQRWLDDEARRRYHGVST